MDAKSCFCNCAIRVEERKYLCFYDHYTKSYYAYTHVGFGVASGPEYADTLMRVVATWMKFGFTSSVWIDDFFYCIDKTNCTPEDYRQIDALLMQVFELLRLRLNQKCIRRPKREVTYTGWRANTLHSCVFVETARLRRYWLNTQKLMAQRHCKLGDLESLIGKLKWVLEKATSHSFNRLHDDVNRYIQTALRRYPEPHNGHHHKAARRHFMETPSYLKQAFIEILQIIEARNYNLMGDFPFTWFIITDAGERGVGGYGWNNTETTYRQTLALPRNMWPDIEANKGDEVASGTRELFGLVKLSKNILQNRRNIRVRFLVDNTNVVDWLLKLDSSKQARKSPLRQALVHDFYTMCRKMNWEYRIDHHPRERPLAQYADFLSKLDSIHIPWMQKNCIRLTERGIRKLGFLLSDGMSMPKIKDIARANERLPWKDMLVYPLPAIKPLQDALDSCTVLILSYRLHFRQPQRYRTIIENLIRYNFQGILVVPGFAHATNLCFRYFVKFRTLYRGKNKHFRNPVGGNHPRVTFFAFVFPKRGCCG